MGHDVLTSILKVIFSPDSAGCPAPAVHFPRLVESFRQAVKLLSQTAKLLIATEFPDCTILLTREANNQILEKRLVRVTGFGPLFEEGTYEQDGHIRVDFGNDTPFLEEEADLDSVGADHIAQNIRQLVDLTNALEKASGATARILWSELGESLAQRLAARLGKGN